MGRLDGKVAIITGATSGMGRDTAYVFAEEGAKVMIVGRNEERAKEVVAKIKENGGEASYVIADMADRSTLDKIVDETLAKYGTVDILFNNAGLLSLANSLDITLEEWDKIMQVNLTSALILAKKVAPIIGKGQGQYNQHRLDCGHLGKMGRRRVLHIQARHERADEGARA